MGEVRFYRLDGEDAGSILPTLAERCLARGQRVLVTEPSPSGREALDARLWSYNPDTFLAHGLAGGEHDAEQPVLISDLRDAKNGAVVHILTGTARVELDYAARFEMTVRLFDGANPDVLAGAREDWKAVAGSGSEAVFWAKEAGRWVEKARAGG